MYDDRGTIEDEDTAKKNESPDDWNVNIGGNVNVGRDFVSRDKQVSVVAGGINVEGSLEVNNEAAKQKEHFENIQRQIEERPNTPPEDIQGLKTNVDEFKTEAKVSRQINHFLHAVYAISSRR